MEEILIHQLKIKKVREMKNPTILMNTEDLKTFIKQVEAKVNNLKIGKHPKYNGIPILANDFIEKGNLFIYDDNSIF